MAPGSATTGPLPTSTSVTPESPRRVCSTSSNSAISLSLALRLVAIGFLPTDTCKVAVDRASARSARPCTGSAAMARLCEDTRSARWKNVFMRALTARFCRMTATVATSAMTSPPMTMNSAQAARLSGRKRLTPRRPRA